MSAPNDGGPAFPEAGLSGLPNGEFLYGRSGMSLRAYIAVHRPASDEMHVNTGRALVGRPVPTRADFPQSDESGDVYMRACQQWWAEASAAYSVMQADALIAALAVKAEEKHDPIDVNERWKALAEEAADQLSEFVPERNCSCHLSPPCNDCVDHGYAREVIENIRAATTQAAKAVSS